MGFHLILPVLPDGADTFFRRLRVLIKEFQAGASEAPEARMYSLSVLMHQVDAAQKGDPE